MTSPAFTARGHGGLSAMFQTLRWKPARSTIVSSPSLFHPNSAGGAVFCLNVAQCPSFSPKLSVSTLNSLGEGNKLRTFARFPLIGSTLTYNDDVDTNVVDDTDDC